MDKRAIIQEFVDFVEGRMSFEEFWNRYETKEQYKKILNDKKPNEKYLYQKDKTINDCLGFYALSSPRKKMGFHSYILRYLEHYNISFTPTTQYEDEYKFRIEIQPSYVLIEDEEYLKEIISSAPDGLTAAQRKKWLREHIKGLFRYEKSPPRWIQDPEWPIVQGKPLVFRGQTKSEANDERVWYMFYDADTGEETVVMQFY